jgi:hypothetical protein
MENLTNNLLIKEIENQEPLVRKSVLLCLVSLKEKLSDERYIKLTRGRIDET